MPYQTCRPYGAGYQKFLDPSTIRSFTAGCRMNVTSTMDMGYAFSAIVPDGVIYACPGMLLNCSGDEWPPNEWSDKPDKEYEELLESFLLDDEWEVVKWQDLRDEELE